MLSFDKYSLPVPSPLLELDQFRDLADQCGDRNRGNGVWHDRVDADLLH